MAVHLPLGGRHWRAYAIPIGGGEGVRKLPRALLMGAVVGVMLVTSVAPVVAAPPANDQGPAAKGTRPDNRPGPFTARQDARRKAAQELILSGRASPNADGVVQLADDKYFEAAVSGEGQVRHVKRSLQAVSSMTDVSPTVRP